MQINLTFKSAVPTWTQRALPALMQGGIFFSLLFVWNAAVESGAHSNLALGQDIRKAALEASIFALLLYFVPPGHSTSTLLINEDAITVVTRTKKFSQTHERSQAVRRGHIQSIFPMGVSRDGVPGIGISETSQWRGRLIGFVYISSTTPDFEAIKALARSWRAPQAG